MHLIADLQSDPTTTAFQVALTKSPPKSHMAKQKFPHLLGSKWTAQQRTMGWRHFQVANRKNEGKLVFAELVASCDSNVRFWVNAKVLKNRTLWAAGWQTLNQIEATATDYKPLPERFPE